MRNLKIYEEPILLKEWTPQDFVYMRDALKHGHIVIINMNPSGKLQAKVWPGEVFIIQRKEVS